MQLTGLFAPKTSATKYYSHIDGLRALAVISVILCHLEIPYFQGGYVGVDIFFVISGFLVTNIINKEIKQKGTFSFLNFYTRRARRILPALLVTMLGTFAASVYLLNEAGLEKLGASMAAAAFSVSNIYFSNISGYFDLSSKINPLLHTWSLGVEEQFYIFWPIIILLTYRYIKGKTLIAITSIFIISLGLNIHNQEKNLAEIYYLTQYRAFEFCIGAALALHGKTDPIKNTAKEALFAIGLTMIAISAIKFTDSTIFPSYNALLPTIGAALIIYSGSARYLGKILTNKPVRFIGLISYSLYLVHWPLITLTKTFNEHEGRHFLLTSNEKLTIIVASLVFAAAMYEFVEQPFRSPVYFKKKQIQTLTKWATLSLAISALGGSAMQGSLWSWRVHYYSNFNSKSDIANYHRTHWGGAGFSGGTIYKGKTSYPSIVMMGDSHSGMLDTGIVSEIAKPNGLTVYTASGGGAGKYASSLLLPGITRLNNKRQALFDKSDITALPDVLNEINKSKNSVLIYSASYPFQIMKAGYLKNHRSIGINPIKDKYYNQYTPFLKGLAKLKNRIGDHKLIMIGDAPGSSFRVRSCAAYIKWFKPSSCATENKINRRTASINVNKVLKEFSQKNKDVFFINPYNYFCSKHTCRGVNQKGVPFYSDGAHLSKTGSKYFADQIKNKILQIMSSP